jgi:uncharacterized protein YyaL (SSP411 family)
LFRARIDETVGWLIREMQMPGGGFASSLDADTEHEEGLTYAWAWPELQEILGDDLEIFATSYDASPNGNWEGKTVLNRAAPESRTWLGDERERHLRDLRARLLSRRSQRPQPARDDKVLADWNGLVIAGLADAAHVSGSSEAKDAAAQAFRFIARSLSSDDRLAHSQLSGKMVFPAVATDYANMIRAALSLFALEGDAAYVSTAEQWYAAAERYHYVPESAAYNLAAHDTPPLFAQPLSIGDEATPAATGTMAGNAARLFALTGDDRYRQRAEEIFARLPARTEKDVVGSASLQSAFDTALRGRVGFIMGEPAATADLRAAALKEPDPALFLAHVNSGAIREGHPAHGKQPTGTEAFFLCDASRCLPELRTPAELTEVLATTRGGMA